jgi:tellurite resistance protein TerC
MILSLAPWVALLATLLILLAVDLKLFARGREPSFREGVWWSLGWLALSLISAGVIWLLSGPGDAGLYTTVYLIERSLSLDNLFVFLLLFAYFGVPAEQRAPLLFWGIVAALALRGAAIFAGVALIEQFHFALYLLGLMLLALAWRVFRGVDEGVDPGRNPLVRAVRRVYPVTDRFHGRRWLIKIAGRRHATPLALALAAIVFADVAFAVDSIPAAFAITRDPLLIWMANIFALLGLRALFVLVQALTRHLRYMDQTIAVVLAAVALKLLAAELVQIGPAGSLAIIATIFTAGIAASLIAGRGTTHSLAASADASCFDNPPRRRTRRMNPQQTLPPLAAADDSQSERRRTRVLLVDDHPAVRAGLRAVIAASPDLTPAAAAATARDALAQAKALAPDVVVVDYYLPDNDGLSLTRQLKALPQPPRVLVYSAYADPPMTIGAIVAGADGIAGKSSNGDELCLAIRTLANGRTAIPPVPPSALKAIASRLDPDDTPILAMLVHGIPAAEIADVLGITEQWLHTRRWAILKHLR